MEKQKTKEPAEIVRDILKDTNEKGKESIMMFIEICATYNLKHHIGEADIIYDLFMKAINYLTPEDVEKISFEASRIAQTPQYQKNVILLQSFKN